MYDSSVSSDGGATRWLLLIHQLPPRPDYLRVKVRRRLQSIGAVALKNSVYLLPFSEDAVEDFQWVRRMALEGGGEATICRAAFLDGVSDPEVEAMFREQSAAEYARVIEAARAVEEPTEGDLARLRRQLSEAAARDFFSAEQSGEAEQAVARLEREVNPAAGERPAAPETPRRATWVTRTGVKVDRIACAWLIRRFIDPEARFKLVPPAGYTPAPGELRFDMFEGEFTHEGEDCTFEVLARHYAADDTALRAVGEVVHDIDCKDDRFGRPEVAGIASLIQGIVASHGEDEARLDAGRPLFDGLYAAFRRAS